MTAPRPVTWPRCRARRGATFFLSAAVLTASLQAAGPAESGPALSAPSPAPAVDPIARRQMQVHFLLASEYYKEGNYSAAINEWREVLRIEPEHALAKEKIKRARLKMEARGGSRD